MKQLIPIIIFILIILYLKSKSTLVNKKGHIGEKKVANNLSDLLSDEYIVFNDILIQKGNSTTQIDHLIISKFGNFVIETKNYSGKIYQTKGKYWKTYYGRKCFKMYNPLWQNMGHINFLQSITPKTYYHSIVVFVGNPILKTKSKNVITSRQLVRYIKHFTEAKQTQKYQDYLLSRIEAHTIENSRENIKHHIKKVKNK